MKTAEEIIDFVRNQMRMSHVYQPLLIRALVRAGGSATLRQLAAALLMEDESQLLYYEDRIKKMPLPVLRSHDVVVNDRDLVSLNAIRLTYEQRAGIELACTEKLAEFLQRRGLATWDYRLIESDPVPTDVRYRVLAAAKGRCGFVNPEWDHSSSLIWPHPGECRRGCSTLIWPHRFQRPAGS